MKNGNSRHVFFVDDEPNIRQAIADTLERCGLHVSCFACPIECLAQLRNQRCHLLITDLRMPKMDGIEFVKELRNLTPWIPVLILTGYGDIPIAVECIKAGAVDLVEKPLDGKHFIEKVESILKENGNHAGILPGGSLTWAEEKVIRLVVDGKSSKDIAHLLTRSKRTVEVHRANAMRKLGAENLIDLVKRAAQIGLVRL